MDGHPGDCDVDHPEPTSQGQVCLGVGLHIGADAAACLGYHFIVLLSLVDTCHALLVVD